MPGLSLRKHTFLRKYFPETNEARHRMQVTHQGVENAEQVGISKVLIA